MVRVFTKMFAVNCLISWAKKPFFSVIFLLPSSELCLLDSLKHHILVSKAIGTGKEKYGLAKTIFSTRDDAPKLLEGIHRNGDDWFDQMPWKTLHIKRTAMAKVLMGAVEVSHVTLTCNLGSPPLKNRVQQLWLKVWCKLGKVGGEEFWKYLFSNYGKNNVQSRRC